MIQHYVTDQIWFDCDKCGKQITHHSMHHCFVMNPDILPTLEEWKLVCKMVKQHELTDKEIEGIARANVDGHTSMEQLKWFARAILKKASEK